MNSQIEDLIIERMKDKDRRDMINTMIEKREAEIAQLEKVIEDLRKYDKVCKERKESLNDTAKMLEEVLTNGEIDNISIRMLVRRILIHQNEDKSLDITFEMNGDLEPSVAAYVDEGEGEPLPYEEPSEEYYESLARSDEE